MAPEVVRRRQTDHRLDIFAFGVSMYEMFAFDLPWQRGSGDGLAAMGNAQTAPPPLSKYYPGVHPEIEAAILKCMQPVPDDRFQSMEGFLKAVARIESETA